MQDKLIHASAYAVMAWLFWHAGRGFIPTALLPVVTVLFCSLFGFSDEWHQSFVDGRQADVYDWLADTLGALLLTITLWKREVVLLGRK
ncbi:MAG: VanZ family protein [Mariprofundus sp.]|nr:VanZ family protein [Mariprofundus sp.]